MIVIVFIFLLFVINKNSKKANKLLEQNNIDLNIKLKECDNYYTQKVIDLDEKHFLLLKQKQAEYEAIDKQKEQKIKTLTDRNTALGISNSTLTGSNSTLEDSITTLTGNNTALEASNSTLTGNNTALQASNSTLTDSNTALQDSITTLTGNNTALQDSITTLTGNNTFLEDSITTLTGINSTLEASNLELTSNNTALQAEITTLRDEIKQNNETHKNIVDELKGRIETANTTLGNNSDQIAQLSKDIADANKTHAEILKTKTDKITKLEADALILVNNNTTLDDQTKDLNSQLADKVLEITNLQASHQEAIEQAEAEHDTEKVQILNTFKTADGEICNYLNTTSLDSVCPTTVTTLCTKASNKAVFDQVKAIFKPEFGKKTLIIGYEIDRVSETIVGMKILKAILDDKSKEYNLTPIQLPDWTPPSEGESTGFTIRQINKSTLSSDVPKLKIKIAMRGSAPHNHGAGALTVKNGDNQQIITTFPENTFTSEQMISEDPVTFLMTAGTRPSSLILEYASTDGLNLEYVKIDDQDYFIPNNTNIYNDISLDALEDGILVSLTLVKKPRISFETNLRETHIMDLTGLTSGNYEKFLNKGVKNNNIIYTNILPKIPLAPGVTKFSPDDDHSLQSSSPYQCLQLCDLMGDVCKGVDYKRSTKQCNLSLKDIDTAMVENLWIDPQEGWDYYSKK